MAEDLGVVPDFVRASLARMGVPGCKVLRWERDWHAPGEPFLPPAAYPARSVAMTGTHDTETTVEWYTNPDRRRERASIPVDPSEPSWGLIEIAMGSRARLAIFPMQDVLGLGGEARMNHPGHVFGNWRWRLDAGALTDELAARLRAATAAGRRLVTKR